MKTCSFQSRSEKTTSIDSIPETKHIYRPFILKVHTMDAAESKSESVFCSRLLCAASWVGGAAKLGMGKIYRHVHKYSLPLQSQLTSNKHFSSRERLWPEQMDRKAIDGVGERPTWRSKKTAWVGDAILVRAENVRATVRGCNSVVKGGVVKTAAVTVTGLSPRVGDTAGATKEGNWGGRAISDIASSWSHGKKIGYLNAILKGELRKQREWYIDNNTNVGRKQTLRPTRQNPTG